MPAKESAGSKVGKLKGMLKKYKPQYYSIELQKKSKEWWKISYEIFLMKVENGEISAVVTSYLIKSKIVMQYRFTQG